MESIALWPAQLVKGGLQRKKMVHNRRFNSNKFWLYEKSNKLLKVSVEKQ